MNSSSTQSLSPYDAAEWLRFVRMQYDKALDVRKP